MLVPFQLRGFIGSKRKRGHWARTFPNFACAKIFITQGSFRGGPMALVPSPGCPVPGPELLFSALASDWAAGRESFPANGTQTTVNHVPQFRDRKGRFVRGWHVSVKGYPRYHSGPYRHQYVHRVRMALSLGRPLLRDEDVHHRDSDKMNFHLSNLQLLSHREHGYVTAAQHWFLSERDRRLKIEWDSYFSEKETAYGQLDHAQTQREHSLGSTLVAGRPQEGAGSLSGAAEFPASSCD